MRSLYAELDVSISSQAAGLELPCRAGCDACCHESVFLSAPEMLLVAEHLLSTRTAEERAAIVRAMAEIAARFADELELLETISPGEERDEVAARVKFRCPLLGADGACTVYEARELNGRTFGMSFDGVRSQAYGCSLTHARLRVLPPEAASSMFDAREARRRLRAAVPETTRVHVYPWWFARIGQLL
jgi:Fe-S-cluster containining protein